MLSLNYKIQLEQYIKDKSIPEHTAYKLRQGTDGDVFFLIDKQMPLTKVIDCIEANTKCSEQLKEYNTLPKIY